MTNSWLTWCCYWGILNRWLKISMNLSVLLLQLYIITNFHNWLRSIFTRKLCKKCLKFSSVKAWQLQFSVLKILIVDAFRERDTRSIKNIWKLDVWKLLTVRPYRHTFRESRYFRFKFKQMSTFCVDHLCFLPRVFDLSFCNFLKN